MQTRALRRNGVRAAVIAALIALTAGVLYLTWHPGDLARAWSALSNLWAQPQATQAAELPLQKPDAPAVSDDAAWKAWAQNGKALSSGISQVVEKHAPKVAAAAAQALAAVDTAISGSHFGGSYGFHQSVAVVPGGSDWYGGGGGGGGGGCWGPDCGGHVDCHKTNSCPPPDCHKTNSCPPPDCHDTNSCPPPDCHDTNSCPPPDCHDTNSCPPPDCHDTNSCPPPDCHDTKSCPPSDCHDTNSCPPPDCHDTNSCPPPDCHQTNSCPPPDCHQTNTCPPDCEKTNTCCKEGKNCGHDVDESESLPLVSGGLLTLFYIAWRRRRTRGRSGQ